MPSPGFCFFLPSSRMQVHSSPAHRARLRNQSCPQTMGADKITSMAYSRSPAHTGTARVRKLATSMTRVTAREPRARFRTRRMLSRSLPFQPR